MKKLIIISLLFVACTTGNRWTIIDEPTQLPTVPKYPIPEQKESYDSAWKRIDDAYPKDPISQKEEYLVTKKNCFVRSTQSKSPPPIGVVKAGIHVVVTQLNDQWYSYRNGFIHEYCFYK